MYNNELRPDTNANKIAGGVYNNGVVSNHAQAVFKMVFSTTHSGKAAADRGFHYYSFVNLITSFFMAPSCVGRFNAQGFDMSYKHFKVKITDHVVKCFSP